MGLTFDLLTRCRFGFWLVYKMSVWLLACLQDVGLAFGLLTRCRLDFWLGGKMSVWLLTCWQDVGLAFGLLTRCHFGIWLVDKMSVWLLTCGKDVGLAFGLLTRCRFGFRLGEKMLVRLWAVHDHTLSVRLSTCWQNIYFHTASIFQYVRRSGRKFANLKPCSFKNLENWIFFQDPRLRYRFYRCVYSLEAWKKSLVMFRNSRML